MKLVTLLLLGATLAQAQESIFDCFAELPLPRYDYFAWHAQLQGSGTVLFRIASAPSDSAPAMVVKASHDVLRLILVRSFAKTRVKACKHDSVLVSFQFEIREHRSEFPLHEVVFRSPATFIISVTRHPESAERSEGSRR